MLVNIFGGWLNNVGRKKLIGAEYFLILLRERILSSLVAFFVLGAFEGHCDCFKLRARKVIDTIEPVSLLERTGCLGLQ